jgi:hypothetical protein
MGSIQAVNEEGKTMDSQTSRVSEEAADFMLAEYTTLRELRLSLDSLGETRVNFFLATISGTVVGLGLINQLSGQLEIVFFINAAVFIGLLLFGLITFARMVERHASIIEYTRGMNRIRRFFAEKHPDIKPYLWLSIYDDKPSLGYAIYNRETRRLGLTGLAPMVGVINSIIATVGTSSFVRLVLVMPVVWCLLIGIVIFLLVILAQYKYLVDRMKQKRDTTEIRFAAPGK